MDEYTICCTGEQARKALELGAPIKIEEDKFCSVAINPTAEQMIGWLEGQEIAIILISIMDGDTIGYNWLVHTSDYEEDFSLRDEKKLSRKEATLAAIDEALEYLENLKQ